MYSSGYLLEPHDLPGVQGGAKKRTGSIGSEVLLDCIVIGADPGCLQSYIHLGRYNFRYEHVLMHSIRR